MPFDGVIPTATARLEKRGIAVDVPALDPRKLHPVQPVLARLPPRLHPAQADRAGRPARAPRTASPSLKSNSKNDRDLQYRLQVYVEDCVGCENCVEVCPTKVKALKMVPIEEAREAGENENVAFFENAAL